jgi:hypothetical protein
MDVGGQSINGMKLRLASVMLAICAKQSSHNDVYGTAILVFEHRLRRIDGRLKKGKLSRAAECAIRQYRCGGLAFVDRVVELIPPRCIEVIDRLVRVEFRVHGMSVIQHRGIAISVQGNIIIVIHIVVTPAPSAPERGGKPIEMAVKSVRGFKRTNEAVPTIGQVGMARIGLVGAIFGIRNFDYDIAVWNDDRLAEIVTLRCFRYAVMAGLPVPARIEGKCVLV